MPLYEYKCTVCGHRFEKIQKFSDPPVEECPKCGSKVEKLASSPAFQFKGSGWYVTDYARKDTGGGAAEKKSENESKPDAAKSDSATKTESKESTPAAPSTKSDR